MAVGEKRSIDPFHADLRFPVFSRGERLLESGASICTPGVGARSSRLRHPAGIFRRGRGAQRIDSAALAAAFGAGSVLWGAVAEHVGIPQALLAAALSLALGLLLAGRYPVGFAEGLNLTPSSRPVPVVVNEPEAEQGPVLVTVEYRIEPQRAAEFAAAMQELGRFRRRDGAVDWGLCGDVAEHGRYLETFVVESWGEYLRQQERATEADRQIWELANAFHLPEGPPHISRLLYAYHQETKSVPNTLGPTH